jgi:hypothetical protein
MNAMPPMPGGGPLQKAADPTQAKGAEPTTPPAPTQLPGQTTAGGAGAVAGAAGGGETAPAATAVAGAANLSTLAPILQQLATILQQLVSAIQAMNVTGGGLPPNKGVDPNMNSGTAQGGRRPG